LKNEINEIRKWKGKGVREMKQEQTRPSVTCPVCEGHGYAREQICCGNGLENGECCGDALDDVQKCEECNGEGYVDIDEDEI